MGVLEGDKAIWNEIGLFLVFGWVLFTELVPWSMLAELCG